MSTYILPHLGVGDYLAVNGLIRNIIKAEDPSENFILFCNKNYKVSISFMFRDIENLTYSDVPPVEMSRLYILPYIKETANNYKLIVIGYDSLTKKNSIYDDFYSQFGIDPNKRFTDFYVQRDKEREKIFFNQFNIKEGEYIFLHEGGTSNNSIIDISKINSDLKIISATPDLTENMFDYCYLIENAAEIHCIESSFYFLSDLLHTKGKLYAHRYTKHVYDFEIPKSQKFWTILK